MKEEKIKMTLVQGDCLKVLPTIPSESVDLVLTDPPYNLGKFENDNLQEEEFKNFSLRWLNECYRILKKNKPLFFTFWSDGMYEMYNIIKKTQFNFVQTLIWYYPNIVGYKGKPLYIRSFDPIFVLSKDKPRKLNLIKGQSSIDCWNILKIPKPQSNFKEDKLLHPTQKPVALFKKIIMENSNESDIILDPFLGSGTTMIACRNLKRSCIGIEINPEYIEITKKRLNWGSSLSDKIEWEFKDMSDLKYKMIMNMRK
jgi:DNA modification methylase